MPLNDAALDLMATALKNGATHMSLHSANPGTTGTSEITAAGRQPIAWDGPTTGGDISLSGTEAFTGGTGGGAVTHVGLWSAATGGTFYGGFALTGDLTFNAAGEYTVQDVTINGSAS